MFKKKAQGAIEFVVIFGAIMFFFILFFTAIQIETEKRNSQKEEIIMQEIALDIQKEISIAEEASNGYIREFKTPLNILGNEYNLAIIQHFIFIELNKKGISHKIPEVNGTIQKGTNTIRKENGTIYLN